MRSYEAKNPFFGDFSIFEGFSLSPKPYFSMEIMFFGSNIAICGVTPSENDCKWSNIVRKSYGGHMGSYEAKKPIFWRFFGDFSIFGDVFA